MSVYTISLNFFRNLKQSEASYIGDVLFCFTNDCNTEKIAIDRDGVILSKYIDVVNADYAEIVKSWTDLLSYIPASTEVVDVDLKDIIDDEEMCLTLCSETNGKKQMVVHSICSLRTKVNDNNTISFNNEVLEIIDKDEAKQRLNTVTKYTITNSIVAGGDVTDSRNYK